MVIETTEGKNTFIGSRSGYYSTTGGTNNSFVGFQSGQNSTTGPRNSFLGSESGLNNTVGHDNVFIGFKSGRENQNGNYNTFVGSNAGLSSTGGTSNTFVGYNVGSSTNNTGRDNTFVGRETGKDNNSGSSNSFFGNLSGMKNTTGAYNTFVGNESGRNTTTGQRNVYIGHQTGVASTTGSYNVCVGTRTCLSGNNSNRVVVGYSTNTNQAYYKKPGKPGDGNIVFGQPDVPDFLNKRTHSLAINNIIEGDFVDKWVLIKDDLKVKRNLDVGGGIKVKGTIRAPFILAQLSTPSDENYKDVLGSLSPDESLEKLLSLKGVRYIYKREGYPDGEHLGFLAQEVEKIVPEIIRQKGVGEEKMLSMNYDGLFPLVVEGIKKLHQENTLLKEKNRELMEGMARLEQKHDERYEQLKAMIATLQAQSENRLED